MKKTTTLKKFGVFDFETITNFKIKNKNTNIYINENDSNFDGVEIYSYGYYSESNKISKKYINDNELLTFMEIQKEDIFLFHNLNFDGDFILKILINNGYTDYNFEKSDYMFNILKSGNKIFKIDIYFEGRKKTIKDSYKFIPLSVNKLGEIIETEKTWKNQSYNQPFMYSFLEKPNKQLEQEYLKYNLIDCEIVYKFLKQFESFISNLKLINIKKSIYDKYFTLASLSKDIFFEMNPEQIKNYTFNFKYSKLFKVLSVGADKWDKIRFTLDKRYDLRIVKQSLYLGGFCAANEKHARKIIKTPIHSFDYNSAYPTHLKGKLPYQIVADKKNAPIKVLEISFDTAEALTNLCPIFNSLYAVGKGPHPNYLTNANQGNLFFFEKEWKIIRKLYKFTKLKTEIAFGFSTFIFDKKYTDTFSDLKNKYSEKGEEPNPVYRQISKLLMNSFTGKLGQKMTFYQRGFSKFGEEQSFKIKNNKESKRIFLYEDVGILNGLKEFDYTQDTKLSPNFQNGKMNNFFIIAYITMLTRTQLFKQIIDVGIDNWYYTDTDSIKLNTMIETGKNLGDFDYEGTSKESIFYRAKGYYFDKKLTYAGFNNELINKKENIDYLKIKLINDSVIHDMCISGINVKGGIFIRKIGKIISYEKN